MLIGHNANMKHFYRVIEFVSKLVGVKLTHERFKLIALDEYKAETEAELRVKSFGNAYLYLLNNIKQSLTTKIINNAYYLLTGDALDEEISNKILETYYKYYDESLHYQVALIHLSVLENIDKNNIEFAFILSNLIMYKRGKNPLIPFESLFLEYTDAVKEKDINKLMLNFASFEATDKRNRENIYLSLDDILYEITLIKNVLKNKYNIKKLYLYGSFAKNKRVTCSDLDLLVIFEEEVFNFERMKLVEEVKVYLGEKLNIQIDLIDFTQALTLLDISEMENIITLI